MDATGPGRLLAGRYRLAGLIGQGGMGTVWRGHDELLGRDVAVKKVSWPPHLTERERQLARRRATREAQVAARLSHRNVVRVYDVVEDDGDPCIVMEYLPYRSLRDVLREEGPLPPARAARIGLGVLSALSAAHAQGVLHRDVKPANILVGSDGRVVLTDFGIARTADGPTLTGDGALLGSPSYIAPERARGDQSAAGMPADLWGLGATLYTAVEGRPPFERDGALATLTAVVADEPERAPHAGPLEPVISGLLRKDPRWRLDAAQAGWLLRQALQPPPPVVSPGRAFAAAGQSSRGLASVLAVLAVAAAAVAGAGLTLPGAPGSRGAAVLKMPGTAAPGPAVSSGQRSGPSRTSSGPVAAARPGEGTGPALPPGGSGRATSNMMSRTRADAPGSPGSPGGRGHGGDGARQAGRHRPAGPAGGPDGRLMAAGAPDITTAGPWRHRPGRHRGQPAKGEARRHGGGHRPGHRQAN